MSGCHRYKRLPRRPGITLVEVVAGLALLGSLLTMMLVAAGRLARQQRVAESKLLAVAELDRLISGFFSNGFPNLPSGGKLNDNERMAWQLRKVNMETIPGCSIVRLSIVDQGQNPIANTDLDKSLASVDVLVSDLEFGRNMAMRINP
jgi:type II secretory pathway pseudopilin PulG